MCRSIRPLFNLAPPVTDEEIRSAALQFVRKVSDTRRPSRLNVTAFDQAVDEIAGSVQRLLESMIPKSPPRTRLVVESRRGRHRLASTAGEAETAEA